MYYWKIEDKQNFYETLKVMYEQHNFPVIPFQRMPNRIFVAYGQGQDDSEPIILYAVPVYVTDSTMCQIAFPVSSKHAPKEMKKGVLGWLLDIICIAMKAQGFDFIYTTSDIEKLMKLFEEKGFSPSDEGVTYYSKYL